MKIGKHFIFLCLLVHLVSVKLSFQEKKLRQCKTLKKLSLVSKLYEGHSIIIKYY